MADEKPYQSMKIVMISHAMLVESTWSKAEVLQRRIDLSVLVPHRWDNSYGIREHKKLPPNFHSVRCLLPGKNHFHLYFHLKRLIRALAPDLIHIDEEPYSLVTYQATRVARALGIPTVLFAWQNIYKEYPWPFRFFERASLGYASGLIGGNGDSIAVFRRKGFSGKTCVIPQFGVSAALLEIAPVKQSGETLRLVYAGRIVPEKGITTVLSALKVCLDVELHLIGSGPATDGLVEQAQALGLASRVHFHGSVSSVEVVRRISEYDCLVLPSRTMPNWKEQFGRVLVEAMATGTPVLGSNSGEIPTVIGNGGLVFIEGDVDSCVAGINRMKSVEYRRILGEAGRRRVSELYTQEVVSCRTIEFYREFAGRSAVADREGRGTQHI